MLLAVETATVEVGVALRDRAGPVASFTARPGRRHVETLHPEIEAVCAAAGVSLAELDAIAVDVGPGLFTGIRVGVAAAKGLAYALRLPVVACTSTDVLLHAARDSARDVAAVVDMRRSEIAWVIAGADGAPTVARLGKAGALAAELARRDASVLLVGDGARRYGTVIADEVAALGGPVPRVAGDELGAPPVAALAGLGARRLAAGEVTTALALAPVYLRAPDARINWTSRPVGSGQAASGQTASGQAGTEPVSAAGGERP